MRRACLGFSLLLTVLGCGDDERIIDAQVSYDAPVTIDGSVADAVVPDATAADADPNAPDGAMPPSAGVDILFVIDNSGSMAEEQAALANGFAGFVNALEAAYGKLPSLHIGVISTDLGAGPFNISGCSGNGDNGVLQSAPNGACTPPSDAYIEDIDLGTSRQTNYTGTLAETFSCIAQLGIDGCGFEQQLESMRRALNGTNAANAGFLRPNAGLAVIILSDEDDCSTEDTSMFDTSQTTVSDPLGPLSSFRCFEFGVVCDPDSPRTPGPRSSCTPRDNSQYMYKPADYVTFLKSLKPESWITVATISGPPTPVVVGTNTMGNPQLDPSCVSSNGEAAPAVRLTTFTNGFANAQVPSICDSMSSSLAAVAAKIAASLP